MYIYIKTKLQIIAYEMSMICNLADYIVALTNCPNIKSTATNALAWQGLLKPFEMIRSIDLSNGLFNGFLWYLIYFNHNIF